jgi:hypothetical protein
MGLPHDWHNTTLAWRKALTLLAFACVLLGPSIAYSGSGSKDPIASLDLAQVSPGFRAALNARVPVTVSFLGDDRIAVSYFDDTDNPYFAAKQRRPRKQLHFFIELFRLKPTSLERSGTLTFLTDTSESRFFAMPSGRFVVNAGRDVFLYDEDQQFVAKRTVEQVCGLQPMSADALYWVSLKRGSEKATALALWEDSLVPDKSFPEKLVQGPTKVHYCWFSARDLSPLARGGDSPVGSYVPSRDEKIDADLRTIITPQGKVQAGVPCQERTDFFSGWIRLLHARNATAFECALGEISFEEGGEVRTKKLSQRKWAARIHAEAWNTPIVAVLQGHVTRGASDRTEVEVFNYENLKTVMHLKLDPYECHAQICSPSFTGVALSPSGQGLAILNGAILSVYDLDMPGEGSTQK